MNNKKIEDINKVFKRIISKQMLHNNSINGKDFYTIKTKHVNYMVVQEDCFVDGKICRKMHLIAFDKNGKRIASSDIAHVFFDINGDVVKVNYIKDWR